MPVFSARDPNLGHRKHFCLSKVWKFKGIPMYHHQSGWAATVSDPLHFSGGGRNQLPASKSLVCSSNSEWYSWSSPPQDLRPGEGTPTPLCQGAERWGHLSKEMHFSFNLRLLFLLDRCFQLEIKHKTFFCSLHLKIPMTFHLGYSLYCFKSSTEINIKSKNK